MTFLKNSELRLRVQTYAILISLCRKNSIVVVAVAGAVVGAAVRGGGVESQPGRPSYSYMQ